MEKALSEYISRLRELTSELRGLSRAVADFKKKCDIAKTVGTSVSAAGTGLAILGALLAIPTGGLSLFVTGAAIGTTVAGVATNGATDTINISKTKKFLEKAEAIAEKAKAASDNFASHLENLRVEYEKYMSQGISEDEAVACALLKFYGRVGAVSAYRLLVTKPCVNAIVLTIRRLCWDLGRLAKKGIVKPGTAIAAKIFAKNAPALVRGAAKGAFIGLNIALQIHDIRVLIKEIKADHPAEEKIEEIISKLKVKISEAETLRGQLNDFERACQEAAEEERRQSQNRRKTQWPAENNKDGADGEDPNRTPNRRTCENRLSEAAAEELIKRLRKLLDEIQGLTEDERKSPQRLQNLLKRFIQILQEMYEAGFMASINPKTRKLRLSITVNDIGIFIEISRDGFHLCDLDPSNMENIFSRVHFGKSSEHTSCNVAVAVYYIRGLGENRHIRYVGLTRRNIHNRVCQEHLGRIARYSQMYRSGGGCFPFDGKVAQRKSDFYHEAGRAADALDLYEVDQLADLLEVFCMPFGIPVYRELRFWEVIWQWFFSTRTRDGGCNRR